MTHELHAYGVENGAGAHITTVYAHSVDEARRRAGEVLDRPGRLVIFQQWQDAGSPIRDQETGTRYELGDVTPEFSTRPFEASHGRPPAPDIAGLVTFRLNVTLADEPALADEPTTTMYVSSLDDTRARAIRWATRLQERYRIPGPLTVSLLP